MTAAGITAQMGRVGSFVLACPVLAGGVVAATGWVAARMWPATLVVVLMMGLQQLFVVTVGVCAVVALTGDPLVELHEATPTGFRQAQFTRAALVALSSLAGAVVMFAPLHRQHLWPRDQGWVTLLGPAGAVLVVTVVAVVAAAYTWTASSTTLCVMAAWMALAMLWDPYVTWLPAQRGLPLAAGCVLLVAGWRRLADGERTITQGAGA